MTVTHCEKNNISNLGNFESENKETKQSLIKEGKFYKKESERLSKYIKEYYSLHEDYPKSQISFYEYGRLIGKGAFGKVNLGLHILTGRIVAIKSFNKKSLRKEGAKKKIYTEIKLMKNLKHPYVVKILDTFETKDYLLIIMENISGGDLLSFVRKRTKLNEKICKYIFKQLLQAIQYIHKNKIIHRDIKLDNILIDLNNNIKLCDFGVGKSIYDGEILTDQCGTPAYIAPEILENKGYEGPPVDIWSSGVVLYSMLSGVAPFKTNNITDLKKMIMSGKFREIPDISKESIDLLHRLLNTNPKKRIKIEEALNHPWFTNNNKINLEENKLTLFTKAEMVLLSKNYIDYRKCSKEEMIENFTLKNLDTKIISLNKNNMTKSFIFAPFNSSYQNSEVKRIHIEGNLKIENNIILFDEKINILNRQYELNNNGEIDHGVLINRSNASIRSNNVQKEEDNLKSKENLEIKSKEKVDEEKPKKILSYNSSKKFMQIHQKRNEEEKKTENETKNPNILNDKSDNINLDEDILKNMYFFGYSKEYIKKCIYNNEVNYCTATYYLLNNNSEITTM